ncbi:Rho GTPase, putative [Entamoeba invadens IP1]|uniref:small monomeric GTPase n=1 Tax=Entamoeba invadens IP1 TaxID=370355 RepID=A0A0A1U3Y2_ENTIV|nr:Rho GTPase, putative [Entamoeba invadens IP1]ELP88871.1 Rho GTPase, putative [Entamoeba invadens IP1]|eukprot:XP_004255642.1 Rho GTPase, putative [Entamoeba invadens IP1]
MSEKPTSIKLVVVGDGAVGKTCLLISYSIKKFPEDYIPTVFDNYVVTLTAGSRQIQLALWDTAGQEEYDQLRPLSYSSASIFLICFSVTSSVSYDNVLTKWHPEVVHFAPKVPIILVGTKLDTRNDPSIVQRLAEQGMTVINTAKGEELKTKIKAVKYLECSAKTGENLKTVFDEAVKTVLMNKPAQKSKCALL